MEIVSIKADTVLLLYHPAETAADVGQQFKLLEAPDGAHGLVVQVISNDSLEYTGIQQEMIQHLLEQRATINRPIDREKGMGEIKSLKLASAKIRKRIKDGQWVPWDGWIPTRHVDILRVEASELLARVIPPASVAVPSFSRFNETPIVINGPSLNMVNVIAGVKGSGKSHLAKHLVLALSAAGVPCVIFDINGEYVSLPRAFVLKWGDNFRPDLAEVGYDMLSLVVRAVYPLPENSQNAFESALPTTWAKRQNYCRDRSQAFSIDVDYLRKVTWSNNQYVQDAIADRLRVIDGLSLFVSSTVPVSAPPSPQTQGGYSITTNFQSAFENACKGAPIVFDMKGMSSTMQQALVKSMNKTIEGACGVEAADGGKGRFPFVFYEEAHFYISTEAILNIITRGRHIGMASIFVTNTPHNLPDTVFRQLDNLFLLSLTHKDDIRNVSKNSFTDEETISSFATRMPSRHALIMGNVTDRYPLIVSVDALPASVPATGKTRSTWDRFPQQ